MELHPCDVVRFRDGEIAGATARYGAAALLRQVGTMPEPAHL